MSDDCTDPWTCSVCKRAFSPIDPMGTYDFDTGQAVCPLCVIQREPHRTDTVGVWECASCGLRFFPLSPHGTFDVNSGTWTCVACEHTGGPHAA